MQYNVYYNLKNRPGIHKMTQVDNVVHHSAARNAVLKEYKKDGIVRALVSIPDCGRDVKSKLPDFTLPTPPEAA